MTERPNCALCDVPGSVYFCLDCYQDLCTECFNALHSLPANAEHKHVKYKDLSSPSAEQPLPVGSVPQAEEQGSTIKAREGIAGSGVKSQAAREAVCEIVEEENQGHPNVEKQEQTKKVSVQPSSRKETMESGGIAQGTDSTPQFAENWSSVLDRELVRRCFDQAYSSTPTTVLQVLRQASKKFEVNVAYSDVTADGKRRTELTYDSLAEKTNASAYAFVKRGFKADDRICLIGHGSCTWVISYLGSICAGCIPCCLFEEDAFETHLANVKHLEPSVIIASSQTVVRSFYHVKDELPFLRNIVYWNDNQKPPSQIQQILDLEEKRTGDRRNNWYGVYTWTSFLDVSKDAEHTAELDNRKKNLRPGRCCCILTTQGTTGSQKPVMLTHDNVTWTASALQANLNLTVKDSIVSCLPMACATSQIFCLHLALVSGCSVSFPIRNDVQFSDMLTALRAIKPTHVIARAPFWQQVAGIVKSQITEAHGTKAKTFSWALERGKSVAEKQQGIGLASGQPNSSKGASWGLAKRLVFSKMWETVGLDECRYAACFGPCVDSDTLDLLASIGRPVLCMYGATETSGVQGLTILTKTHSSSPKFRHGYSGRALPGTKILFRKQAGEVSPECELHELEVAGRNVMLGYYKQAKRCLQVFDDDGVFRTHDIGKIDSDSMLIKIECRDTEIITLSTGKQVSACFYEAYLKQFLPFVSGVVMIGNGMPFVSCLITLPLKAKQPSTTKQEVYLDDEFIKFLQHKNIRIHTIQDARKSDSFTSLLIQGVQRVNQSLPPFYPAIKRFSILGRQFSVEGGELTPLQELRRLFIAARNAKNIREIYRDSWVDAKGGPGDVGAAAAGEGKEDWVSSRAGSISQIFDVRGEKNASSVAVSEHPAPVPPPPAAKEEKEGATSSVPDVHQSFGVEEEKKDGGESVVQAEEMNASSLSRKEEDAPEDGELGNSKVEERERSSFLKAQAPPPEAVREEEDEIVTHALDEQASVELPLPTNFYSEEAKEPEEVDYDKSEVESIILDLVRAVSNVIVIGEDKPFYSCLISLKTNADGTDELHKDAIRAANGFCSAARTVSEAKDNKEFRNYLVDAMSRVNKKLQSHRFSIRKFIILLADFLPESYHKLGPSSVSASVREAVSKRFERAIASLYTSDSKAADQTLNLRGGVSTIMPEGNDATREIYDDDTRVFDSYQGETSKADQDFFNDQSAVNEEILQMVLDMDFGFVLTAMDKFSTGLKRDLSRCLRVDEYRVSIKNVSSGSVVVVVAILPGREDEKTPRELVQELRDQATMAESRLFAGVYSSRLKKISSLTGEFFEVECHHIDKKDGKNDSHSSGHFSFARDDPPARKSIPAGLDNSRVRSSMSSRSGAGADRSRDDRTTPQKSASSSSPTAQADGTGVATPSVGQAAAGGRQSMGTPSFATPSPLGQTTDTRGLQVTNMAFEPVHVEVFKRSGESIIKAEVPPNGCFPSGDVNSIWRIPAGKDVCFAVFLPSEPEYRRTFCLPEFDRRSVRVRVEIDPTRRTVMVSPQMKKGQQIQGNIDAYSLRLNMIQDSTAKFNSNSLFADEQ